MTRERPPRTDPHAAALTALASAHPRFGNLITSIVKTQNPVFAKAQDALGPLVDDMADWPDAQARARTLWDTWAPHVAVFEVEETEGSWTAQGTAFRTPGLGRRMLTARHVLEKIYGKQRVFDHPYECRPFGGDAEPRQMRVRFTDDATAAGGETIVVGTCLWVHADADIVILDLEGEPAAVTGETSPPDLDGVIGDELAVLGFPMSWDPADPARPEPFSASDLMHKHLSMGHHRKFYHDVFECQHSASTLPGYSGGPVIDLASGRLVGVHTGGIPVFNDPREGNKFVPLSDVFEKTDGFRQVLAGGAGPVNREARRVSRIDWQGTEFAAMVAASLLDPQVQDLRSDPILSAVSQDRPDFRDLAYVPSLQGPKPEVLPPKAATIRNQKLDRICVACALAALIERQLPGGGQVSVRMLDALARSHDEWLDGEAEGTSLRGALKGFFHNGVCAETLLPHRGAPGEDWVLTREMAKDARSRGLGAYFRIGRAVTDLQMAVQETGGALISAHIHKGWARPREGVIQMDGPRIGRHAFAVTGYTDEGFIVQNSWGEDWGGWRGRKGHALWQYADWAASVIDAWVLRIAPRAPAAFNLVARDPNELLPRPRRSQLLGHLALVEADQIISTGSRGVGLGALRETAAYLASNEAAGRYRRLMLVFHDPFVGTEMAAQLAGQMTQGLKELGLYPLHVLYGQDEIETCTLRVRADADRTRAIFGDSGVDATPYVKKLVTPHIRRALAGFRADLDRSMAFGPLWQALAAVAGDLPDRIGLATLALGAGCIVEEAARRGAARELEPLAGAARIWIAPVTVPARGTHVLRLDAAEAALPVAGSLGEWSDLVAEALDTRPGPRAGRRSAHRLEGATTLADAVRDESLAKRLADALAG